ncbi:MAG: AsmA family protein, partial [Beijerinckiaceae bacterium]|nr:AsmA family protein [Beijerinckiaceae bacterium]
WAEPRIYPEIAGILDDPAAAYAKLRALGKGLLGSNADLGSGLDALTQGLEKLFGSPMMQLPENEGEDPAGGAEGADPPAQQDPNLDLLRDLFRR